MLSPPLPPEHAPQVGVAPAPAESRQLPLVPALPANSSGAEAPERLIPAELVMSPVHVFACPKLREATTAPVVGEIVRVLSELLTEATAPALHPDSVRLWLPSSQTTAPDDPANATANGIFTPLALPL